MSLLLDALKKAAEQKAENSAETGAERESSDDTSLLDQTITKRASDSEAASQREPSDETDLPDQTSTDFTVEGPAAREKESRDETDLQNQTSTDIGDREIKNQHARPDRSQFDLSDTDLNYEEADEHIVVADEPIAGSFNEDESLLITDDDVTAFLGEDTPPRGERDAVTDTPQYESVSENLDTSSDDSDELDEELSISLFKDDDTLTDAGAVKQEEVLSEEIELELAPQDDITKNLKLAEVPGTDNTQVEIGRSDNLNDSSLTPVTNLHTLTEGQTSTRTFAPDNYDRTLRKPGSGDASKLFAGVRSDTDIVMTPEYAKKMFRSKSTARRIHNFKIYTGTALSILVVVAVLGVLELEQDTNDIDNSLRHLKRDPMPGLIKNTSTSETFTDVFAPAPGSEVDATTLQLVENAESQVDTEEVVAVKLRADEESPVENSGEAQIETEVAAVVEPRATPVESGEESITNTNSSLASISEDESISNNKMQISSSSRISDKDRLLREAYTAYQRGDDELALTKYNVVLDLDPANRNALLARAAIHIQNNRIPEAIRDYQTLLIANPKDSLAMSSMIAVANYSPEQSESQLKLMIRDEPDSPYLNFALGNIFGAQNRWQEAQGRYFAALENNPDDPNYAYNLAVSLEHISKPTVAIAYYERALENFTKGLATFNREVVDARLEMLRQL